MKDISASDLAHRVIVCGEQTAVIDGDLVTGRNAGFVTMAAMRPVRVSNFAPNGQSFEDPRELASHVITIRYRSNVDITAQAWVFEKRRKSGARWFKVLGRMIIDEGEQLWELRCREVEHGALVQEQMKPDLLRPVKGGML
jgi:head-tail adaptor